MGKYCDFEILVKGGREHSFEGSISCECPVCGDRRIISGDFSYDEPGEDYSCQRCDADYILRYSKKDIKGD